VKERGKEDEEKDTGPVAVTKAKENGHTNKVGAEKKKINGIKLLYQ